MNIKKPIIILGTGRSGTTIFHKILSEHPNLAWLSQKCDICPDKPVRNRQLMRLLEVPLLNGVLRRKYYAGECWNFWEYYCKGFSEPFRDLRVTDLTRKSKKKLLHVFSGMTTEKKSRLLIKITGWPRIDFLAELFKDAIFIHVLRDGRAVANSLVNVHFWRGWQGPEKWRWGPLPDELNDEWNMYNQSFIVLAAIQWKILMDSIKEASVNVDKSRFLEVKYEDLCLDPLQVFKKVIDFTHLEWTESFEEKVKSYELKNTNIKYERELNDVQIRELNDILGIHLQRYGYL